MDLSKYWDAAWPHLGTIIGFGFAVVLIARLMSEKRRPSNTVAWMLVIVLIPYIGVPLYLIFGGRKIARRSQDKQSLNLSSGTEPGNDLPATPFGILSHQNSVQFLHTGVEAFTALEEQIKAAKETIDITTFILSHDAVGRRIVKALSAKAKQGVKIRLLLDAVGSFGKKTLYMLELEKAGGQIERFMPVLPFLMPGKANLRNHRKIAIFDEQRAIIGGRNIGRDYMGPTASRKRWKDFGSLIEGPAVTQLNAIFEADWTFACKKRNYQSKEPSIAQPPVNGGKSSIEIMASGPDTEGDPLYEKILSTIQEAERSITIVTPYYVPDEVLQRTLFVKARAGKAVTLLVPRKSNHPITDLARDHHLRELIKAGANVQLYNAGMIHGKGMLIDGKIAMTGSANVDFRSLFVNYEIGAFFYSASDIAQFQSWIDDLLKDAMAFYDVHVKPPSLLREVAEDLSRLLTPLL